MPPAAPTPLAPLLSLDEAEAQAWRSLERRLRQLHGFGLLVCFVRTPLLAQRVRERLALQLAAQEKSLQVTAVTHPEDLAQISLQSLFAATDSATVGAHWLEAYRGAGQPSWDAERRQLVTRLNERRSRLEAEFHAPLILLLPAESAAEMADLAPDLWHIRIQTILLSARSDSGGSPSALVQPRAESLHELDSTVSLQVEPEVSHALQYWLSQWRVNFDDYGSSELPPEHPNLWALSLWDGVRAVDVCLSYGRFQQAHGVARDLLNLARTRAIHAKSDQQNSALRDVSVSLNRVGAVAQAQGDWSGAEAVYRESLELRRQLVQRLGGTPEALDDLGISLVRNALVPNGPAHELLTEAATIYAALVQRCPQVRRYADLLKLVRDQLAASTTPDPELPSDSK